MLFSSWCSPSCSLSLSLFVASASVPDGLFLVSAAAQRRTTAVVVLFTTKLPPYDGVFCSPRSCKPRRRPDLHFATQSSVLLSVHVCVRIYMNTRVCLCEYVHMSVCSVVKFKFELVCVCFRVCICVFVLCSSVNDSRSNTEYVYKHANRTRSFLHTFIRLRLINAHMLRSERVMCCNVAS